MRAKPQPSAELRYLRLVMSQDWEKDDKTNVMLGHYRQLLINDPKWVAQQKRIAEKEHRDELVEWKKDCDQEARELAREQKGATTEDKMEPVEELLSRLINVDWEENKKRIASGLV